MIRVAPFLGLMVGAVVELARALTGGSSRRGRSVQRVVDGGRGRGL